MISAHGLTKQYGAVRAVDDLSFDVAAGTVTGFLGPNGAGKSTTMPRGRKRVDTATSSATAGAARKSQSRSPSPTIPRAPMPRSRIG